jgi:hypothetical protein
MPRRLAGSVYTRSSSCLTVRASSSQFEPATTQSRDRLPACPPIDEHQVCDLHIHRGYRRACHSAAEHLVHAALPPRSSIRSVLAGRSRPRRSRKARSHAFDWLLLCRPSGQACSLTYLGCASRETLYRLWPSFASGGRVPICAMIRTPADPAFGPKVVTQRVAARCKSLICRLSTVGSAPDL